MSSFKLYTRTGDDGTTGLLSGKRLSKHHVRIKAYGTVDELNAWVGMIRNFKTDFKGIAVGFDGVGGFGISPVGGFLQLFVNEGFSYIRAIIP